MTSGAEPRWRSIDLKMPDGSVEHFRTVAVQPFVDGKMTGERVYGIEGMDRVVELVLANGVD